MHNIKRLFTPSVLLFPQFKTEDGISVKLSCYEITDDGIAPVYVPTEEVSTEEALNILLGGDGE